MAGHGPMAIREVAEEGRNGMAGAWLGSAGIQPALAARGVGGRARLRKPTRGGACVGVGSGVFGRSINWAFENHPTTQTEPEELFKAQKSKSRPNRAAAN
jgi:hypothetical protein